jgi:hypothetical protein
MSISLIFISIFSVMNFQRVESLRFMTVGDWGKLGTIQSSVAAQMAKTANDTPIEFIISSGDNFYEVSFFFRLQS